VYCCRAHLPPLRSLGRSVALGPAPLASKLLATGVLVAELCKGSPGMVLNWLRGKRLACRRRRKLRNLWLPGCTAYRAPGRYQLKCRSLSVAPRRWKPSYRVNRLAFFSNRGEIAFVHKPLAVKIYPAVRVRAASPLRLKSVWNNLHRKKRWICHASVSWLLQSLGTYEDQFPQMGLGDTPILFVATLCGPPQSLRVAGCTRPDSG